jgi:hypothetical protein
MKLPHRTVLSLAALLAACSPSMLPSPDGGDAAARDSAPDQSAPEASLSDRAPPRDGDGADAARIPDAFVDGPTGADASADASPGIDARVDASPGVDASADAAPPADASAPDGGGSACALMTQPPLALPTPGSPTVVMNTWAPMGASSAIARHGCTSFGAGSDHIYPLTVDARTTLQFTAAATMGTTPNPTLSLRRACALETTELACDTDSGIGNAASFRVTLEPGTYFLVADEFATSSTFAPGGAYTLTVSAPTLAPNASCAMATPWMAGTMAAGNTNTGGTADRSCNTTTATGPEVFFRYTLPGNTRSVITAAPLGMPPWRAYLRLRDDCANTACSAVGTSPGDGLNTTLTLENRAGAPRTYLLSVGSYELGTGGAFTLSDALTMLPPVPMNAVCDSAPMLPPLAILPGETTAGTIETRSTFSCQTVGGSGGTLAYYSINVPAGRTVAVTVTPEATFDPAIRLFVGCTPTTCGAYRNSFSTGQVERASYTNSTMMDQTVIIAVGGTVTGSTGTFELRAQLVAPAATNGTCASARPLTPTSPAIAQNAALATEPNALPCEPTATGNVLHYSVNVPAGQTAIVTAAPYGTSTDPVLRVTDACGSMSCLTSANTGFSGTNEQLFFTNDGMTARDYIVTLGSRAPTSAGVNDLSVRFITIPTNATCTAPRALGNAEVATVQDTGAAVERRTTLCATTTSGAPLLYYAVNVPAMRTGVIRVTPTGSLDPTIRVFLGCSPTSCTGYRNSFTAGQPEILSFNNATPTDQTYIVGVGGALTNETGVFDVRFDLLPAAPVNTSCATARLLSPTTPALLQNQSAATEPNALSCEPTATGNVLYYSVNVPAGQTAIVTASPLSTSADPVLRVTDACGTMACIASANASFGGTNEQLFFTNSGMAARDYIVTLGSRTALSVGVHDVSVRFVTIPTNATCASPRPLTVGATLAMEDTGAAIERRSTFNCATGTSGGPLLYYTVTVPPNQTGRIRVTPAASFDASIRVFQGCSPTACLGYRDAVTRGMTEEITFRNSTMMDQSYTVAVGGVLTTETGTFSIAFDLLMDPYLVVSTMSATCDDIAAMSTVLPSLVGDDASTGTAIPLPFPFSLFGEPATHWGANTNGLMQLFSSATATATTAYSNTDLNASSASIPGGLAIFWDDLEVDAVERPGAVVRHATLGAAPNRRFVLEWFNVGPLGGGTDTMRFQIKLSEGSNIAEYHYCSMVGSTRATGDSASIGLQNLGASRSVGVSFNMPTATTGRLIRFVPR